LKIWQLVLHRNAVRHVPVRVEDEVGDLVRKHQRLPVGLARDDAHLELVRAVLDDAERIASDVDPHVEGTKVRRQPAPALQVGSNLLEACLDGDVHRGPSGGAYHSVHGEAVALLEVSHGLGEGRVDDEGVVRGPGERRRGET
jgi:hypothetical protein